MRITSKGQVTIPVEIREKAGLLPNTEVEWEIDGDIVRLRPAGTRTKSGRKTRGQLAVEALKNARAKMQPLARTTDEIMALLRPR
jgi:AbrB family looped-hinge helix DNA binding protein